MDNKSGEKYISPGPILPLQTNAYVDLRSSATFVFPKRDIVMFANFIRQPTTTPSVSGGADVVINGSIVSGTALAVVAGTEVNLLNTTITISGITLYGMQFSGDTNAVYSFYLSGILKMRWTVNIMSPNIDYNFPLPILTHVNDNITLTVTNLGTATSNFTGSVIGTF